MAKCVKSACQRAVVIVFTLCSVCIAQTPPTVFWASGPVRPDETVILTGDGLGADAQAEIARLEDGAAGQPTPQGEPDLPAQQWTRIEPILRSSQSLHFTIPSSYGEGIYACRARTSDGSSKAIAINAPDIWWTQGDRGNAKASPGGWLRVFGKSLHRGEEVSVALVREGADPVMLRAAQVRDEPNCWALTLRLPADLPEGEYTVHVHNGFGGAYGWSSGGAVSVSAPRGWKQGVFNVADFAQDTQDDAEAINAALAAAGENGGGIVLLPRGSYRVDDTLSVPRNVVLRGEAQRLVSITWADREEPLKSLIRGQDNFAIEDLTLYAHNHYNGIVSDRGHREGAGNVRICNVRMRLDRLVLGRRFDDPLAEAERRARLGGRAAAIQVGGDNVQVTDCDIYISPIFKHGSVLGFILDRVRGGLFANNRVYGPARATLMAKGGDGIIFEGNDLMGGCFLGTHHTPGDELGGGGSLINPYFRNLYFARNVVHDNNWWDRELFALDSHGPAGAYEGHIVNARGTRVTLEGEPRYPGENWRRWIGACMYVLDGKGAGQYRRIAGGDGRQVEINRPWSVDPDEGSRVSIAKFHGRMLVVNNEFRDGGNVMLWAGGLDSVVAGNRVQRIGVILSITSYIYKGLMPAWYLQFLGNEVIEGNRSFGGSTGIGHATYPSERFFEVFDGFPSRAVVLRRNIIHNNGRVYVSGAVRDAVIEHNVIRKSDSGIGVSGRGRARPKLVLIRANRLEDVANEFTGDCLDAALIED